MDGRPLTQDARTTRATSTRWLRDSTTPSSRSTGPGGVYTLGSFASQLISILNDSAITVSDTTFRTPTPRRLWMTKLPGDPNSLYYRACYGGRRGGYNGRRSPLLPADAR